MPDPVYVDVSSIKDALDLQFTNREISVWTEEAGATCYIVISQPRGAWNVNLPVDVLTGTVEDNSAEVTNYIIWSYNQTGLAEAIELPRFEPVEEI
jgi:hypothetical protein